MSKAFAVAETATSFYVVRPNGDPVHAVPKAAATDEAARAVAQRFADKFNAQVTK